MATIWSIARAAGVDVVLAGHEHQYARFAPQDDAGNPAPAGPRSFVIGTGGRSLYPFTTPPRAAERVREDGRFGVLELRLRRRGYDWRFVAEDLSVLDAGRGTC
jgi:hypothetical protein